MSTPKSNATLERPNVIPIATFQCFPRSDLILMILPLSHCAYYLYLESCLSGLKFTKLQTAIALDADLSQRIQAESLGCGMLTLLSKRQAFT